MSIKNLVILLMLAIPCLAEDKSKPKELTDTDRVKILTSLLDSKVAENRRLQAMIEQLKAEIQLAQANAAVSESVKVCDKDDAGFDQSGKVVCVKKETK